MFPFSFISIPFRIAENFVDQVFKTNVSPKPGCIVKCGLNVDWEHTGVYVNDDKIVELTGNGKIRKISPGEFLNYSSSRTGASIYIACDKENENVLHNYAIAKRAEKKVGSVRDYNVFLDNCHQFTAGCILDDFDNNNTAFWTLEMVIEKEMNYGRPIKWLVMEEILKYL